MKNKIVSLLALVSYNALSARVKGTDTTLLVKVKGNTSNVGEHTHVYVTKTVAGIGGHYEQVQVGTEKVQVGTEKRQY